MKINQEKLFSRSGFTMIHLEEQMNLINFKHDLVDTLATVRLKSKICLCAVLTMTLF